MVSTRPSELCFLGEHCFLSNLYLSNIKYKAHVYKSAEHFFQTAKCVKEIDKENIRRATTARMAKIIGRFVEVRPDWEEKKVDIMEKILRIKFQKKSRLRRLLRETGDVQLIHLNYWQNTFWGSCACSQHRRTGESMLGAVLMKIRAEN